MNDSINVWLSICYWNGVDPGSREGYEYIHTPWACGFEEEAIG